MSYFLEENIIIIQVVVLEGTNLSKTIRNRVKNNLKEFQIKIIEVPISKDRFNESKGDWQPKYYSWLETLLFSKGEIL